MLGFKWPFTREKSTQSTPVEVVSASKAEPTTQERIENRVPLLTRQSQLYPVPSAVFIDKPYWIRLRNLQNVFNAYHTNPVFYAIVNIKANADANRRFEIVDRKTEETIPVNTKKSIPMKMYRLLKRPNALQNLKAFLKQRKINLEVAGNSMMYANSAFGFTPDWNSIQTLTNIWPQHMNVDLTGKYFDAINKEDIIRKWMFEYGTFRREFTPQEILHTKKATTELMDGLIMGRATAYSQEKPLSNITMAYESRNVIMRNRGMDMVMSSAREDANGKVPLQTSDKEDLQEDMLKYGTLEGQWQWLITRQPVTVTPINRDVRKLGLFEEITYDTMLCAIAWGVPEILINLSLQGATFENQIESVRRLYQDTIIPEAEEDDMELNTFFGLDDTEFMLRSSFDHISALQESRESTAKANAATSLVMEKMFLLGGCTLNQWLNVMDMPSVPGGDVYIMQMEETQRAWILQMLGKGAPADPNAPKPGEPGAAADGEEGEQPLEPDTTDETDEEEPKGIKVNGHKKRKKASAAV